VEDCKGIFRTVRSHLARTKPNSSPRSMRRVRKQTTISEWSIISTTPSPLQASDMGRGEEEPRWVMAAYWSASLEGWVVPGQPIHLQSSTTDFHMVVVAQWSGGVNDDGMDAWNACVLG